MPQTLLALRAKIWGILRYFGLRALEFYSNRIIGLYVTY